MEDFARKFGVDPEHIPYTQVGTQFVTTNEALFAINDAICRKNKCEPELVGELLGVLKKRFVPSINVLRKIAKHTKQKVYVDEKTEWLFLCGRDVFLQGIMNDKVKGALPVVSLSDDVIVCNSLGEVLGYGTMLKGRVAVKNRFNLGNFLHRE